MTALLFFKTLAQGFQQLVEAAERLDLLLFFLGEIFLRKFLQPFFRNFGGERFADKIEPLEDVAEHAIELVEIALVLHQRGAGEIVKILDPARRQILVHRLHQRQVFAQRDRHAGAFEFGEKGDEHRCVLVLRRHTIAQIRRGSIRGEGIRNQDVYFVES